MKDRKGFLLAEYTLKAVVAGISLLLLVFLFISIYSSFMDKKKLEQAGNTLNGLYEKMIIVKNSENTENFVLLEPRGWKLLGYSKNKPEICNKNCICLCEDLGIKDKITGIIQSEKCSIKGVCKNFDEKINSFDIELRNEVSIIYREGGFELSLIKNESS